MFSVKPVPGKSRVFRDSWHEFHHRLARFWIVIPCLFVNATVSNDRFREPKQTLVTSGTTPFNTQIGKSPTLT
jgi:hypothetical protein